MRPHLSIIGMDAITSLGENLEVNWKNILDRREGVLPLRRFKGGRFQTDVAGELPEHLLASLGASRSLAFQLASRVGRGALKQAWPQGLNGRRVGLVLSTTKGDMSGFQQWVENRGDGSHYNPYLLSLDLAKHLDLCGPVVAVSNACASGLVAVAHAGRLLLRGEAEFMLVIGVDTLSEFVLSGFSALRALSAFPCRPFDQNRDGLSLGEGAGAMVLAGPDNTIRDAICKIVGWGISNDANHITGPSRTGEGLKRAIFKTMEMAHLQAEDIDYINAHGTGTLYNDEMEAQAFSGVFTNSSPFVISFKGYFGHTLGAAGVIETALTAMTFDQNIIPASLGFDNLGVSKQTRVCRSKTRLDQARCFLTVKSGFGGINAALALSKGI